MAFQQGLSGLNAASAALNITSNNVANAGTVGFKSAQAHFADVFANSLSGSGAAQVGIGASVSAVQQQFSQGTVTTTNNPLDLAINGGGFYRMSQNGVVTYSRTGQFHLDKDGFIVDDRSRNLTGYPAVAGVIVQSAPANLQLSSADQAPVATGSSVGGAFTGVKAGLNFDSRSTVPSVSPFSTSDPLSYNFSTALSVFDSLGNPHTLTLYAVKTAVAGGWTINANVDGTAAANSPLSTSGLSFDTSGQLTGGTGTVGASIDLTAVMLAQGKVNSAATPLAFNIDFGASTQYGSSFSTNTLQQDGYTSGHLAGVSVGADGTVRGNYTNGQARDLGQVVLANFTNPNGLSSLGGNQWGETSTSGPALVGAPNTGSLGVLQSAAVEESNVDLTAALVDMITEQRNYQANAQSIKTQDQIMQTLVNLR